MVAPIEMKVKESSEQLAHPSIAPQFEETMNPLTQICSRPMVEQDIQRIVKILEECEVFFPKEMISATYTLKCAISPMNPLKLQSYVLERNPKEIIGAICFGEEDSSNSYWKIHWLVISKILHGKGLGHQLMDLAEAEIRKRKAKYIVLETGGSNFFSSARMFYRQRGFYEAGRLPSFYDESDDKVIMMQRL